MRQKDKKLPVSVILNVCNFELDIEECLKLFNWCKEIIVLSIRGYNNIDVCKKYTDKVYVHEKIRSYKKIIKDIIPEISQRWVLIVDNDEKIPTEIITSLSEFIDKSEKVSGLYLPRKNIFYNKEQESLIIYQLRFFDRLKINPKHENFIDGETKFLKLETTPIECNYHTISDFINHINLYTDLMDNFHEDLNFDFKSWTEKMLSNFYNNYLTKTEDSEEKVVFNTLNLFTQFFSFSKIWNNSIDKDKGPYINPESVSITLLIKHKLYSEINVLEELIKRGMNFCDKIIIETQRPINLSPKLSSFVEIFPWGEFGKDFKTSWWIEINTGEIFSSMFEEKIRGTLYTIESDVSVIQIPIFISNKHGNLIDELKPQARIFKYNKIGKEYTINLPIIRIR